MGGKEVVVSADVCCGWEEEEEDFLGSTRPVASLLGGDAGNLDLGSEEGWPCGRAWAFEMLWPAGSAQPAFLKQCVAAALLRTSASCSLISCF